LPLRGAGRARRLALRIEPVVVRPRGRRPGQSLAVVRRERAERARRLVPHAVLVVLRPRASRTGESLAVGERRGGCVVPACRHGIPRCAAVLGPRRRSQPCPHVRSVVGGRVLCSVRPGCMLREWTRRSRLISCSCGARAPPRRVRDRCTSELRAETSAFAALQRPRLDCRRVASVTRARVRTSRGPFRSGRRGGHAVACGGRRVRVAPGFPVTDLNLVVSAGRTGDAEATGDAGGAD